MSHAIVVMTKMFGAERRLGNRLPLIAIRRQQSRSLVLFGVRSLHWSRCD
ncbi:hypothetical protein [Scytonema sp. UIC 10036]|nr:hypothetical protein [Scytonema sp. UIC 10036]